MQNRSTHGLRLDQLAELFRAAVRGADPADRESPADQQAEPVRHHVLKSSALFGIVLLVLVAVSILAWMTHLVDVTFTRLAAGLLCLAIVAWRIVPLLVAEPTIALDYPSQANQASKPADYDPGHNAAPHYEGLFSQFIPLPEALKDKHRLWPTDLSPEEFKAWEEWAPVNNSALSTLAQTARCP